MMNFKTALCVCAAALLTACATSTPYQPAAKLGASGYSSTQIESNRYTVSFSGNSLTDRETVETYLLYRAAELAVNNGYDYFTVAEKDTDKETRLISTPSYGYGQSFYPGFSPRYNFFHPSYGWSSRYRSARYRNRNRNGFGFGSRRGFHGGFHDPFWDNVDYREITKFTANAQVLMGRGSKPSQDNAFNAREVLQNLSAKVIFPEEKS